MEIAQGRCNVGSLRMLYRECDVVEKREQVVEKSTVQRGVKHVIRGSV